jgi:hypothetical protein
LSIKGFRRDEVVSVFDPNRKAYHEVPVTDLILQLKSFGMTDEEIESRIAELKAKASEKEQ